MSGQALPGRDRDLVFTLRTQRDRSKLTVRIEGTLDARSGHHLLDILEELASPGDEVLIDMTALAHMDRRGADALSRAVRSMRARGSSASLQVADDRFKELLHPQGLTPLAHVSITGGAPPEPIQRRRPG